MNILPTFGFKGNILPILNKNKLYLFINNDSDVSVLLNLVSIDLNKFITISEKSSKLVECREYSDDIRLKIFYMGQDLFEFHSSDIEKNTLLLYSNFILKDSMDTDKIHFSLSFLNGCKINTSCTKPQNLYVKFVNSDTNEIIHEDSFVSGEPYQLDRSYFINYDISIYNSTGKKIYHYNMSLKDKTVLIRLDSKALGDTLAWIPYVEEFRKKHGCDVICSTYWNDMFKKSYPNVKFIPPTEIVDENSIFSSYKLQCSIPFDITKNPIDYRELTLQEISSKSLGLLHSEIKPIIFDLTDSSFLSTNYVVISTASTSKAKLWNYDGGWQKIVDFLNNNGFQVVLLQKEPNTELKNIINMSSNSDMLKAINILKHCKFHIGLSSGMSWLAWALNKKVIMISGFTDSSLEFKDNNYRIINKNVCNGCWGDKKHIFDKKDWFWCPRNKNFECTTEIKPETVIKTIERVMSEINI